MRSFLFPFPHPRRLFPLTLVLLAGFGTVLAWPGRLVDPNGRPHGGARITIVGESGGVVSSADGRFRLPSSRLPVTLLVELQDGKDLVVDVPAQELGNEIVVTLDPRFYEEVLTTAPVAGELMASPAAQVWSLSAEELKRRGDTSLQQALASLPGAEPASPDPDRVPVFRGLGDNRTLFLLDGAAVGTERRAGVSGGGMHAATLAGVEVARGPSALVYGSGAMGGVLLVKSPWASFAAGPETELTMEGRGGGAPSWSLSAAHRQAGWSFALGHRDASDPESAGGARLKGGYRQDSAFVGKSWVADGSLLRAGVRTDRLSDAYRPRLASSTKQTLVPHDEQVRAVLQIDRPGDVERSLVAWWGTGSRQILQLRELPSPTRGTRTDQNELGARILWRGERKGVFWTAGSEIRGRYGVDASLELRGAPGASPPAGGTPVRDGQAYSAAVFGSVRRELLKWLELSAGGRLEPSWSEAHSGETFYEDSDNAWAASASAMARAGRAGSFTLQLARSYRLPSITDRYLGGITGKGFKEASPGLQAESALHFDLGWHLELAGLRVSATAFHYRIDDVLVREFLEEDRYRFINAGEATIEGVEAGATWRLPRSWSLYAGIHHVRGTGRDGEWLAGIPADGLSCALQRHLSRGGMLRAEFVAARHDPRAGSGEEEIPGFGVLNLSAVVGLRDTLRVRVGLQNALDRSYRVTANEGDPAAPGATLILALEWARK